MNVESRISTSPDCHSVHVITVDITCALLPLMRKEREIMMRLNVPLFTSEILNLAFCCAWGREDHVHCVSDSCSTPDEDYVNMKRCSRSFFVWKA
jgi:hypothetical protein